MHESLVLVNITVHYNGRILDRSLFMVKLPNISYFVCCEILGKICNVLKYVCIFYIQLQLHSVGSVVHFGPCMFYKKSYNKNIQKTDNN